jgi:glycosyltransferase involved in cell wall biosynthesis
VNTFNSLSVIIPAINETYLLQTTVGIILETCEHQDIAEMIIVLCDRTTDACIRTAENLRDQHPSTVRIVVFFQKEPFLAAAYKESFAIAQGSHVLIMSADTETDPYLVKDFIAKQKICPDAVIIASRWIRGGGFDGYNKVKLVCNFIFGRMLSVLFWSSLTDMACGYKSMPTMLAESIDWKETKHPFYLEMALKPLRLGVHVCEIPFQWRPRTEGESQNSFFQNFKYFRTVFTCRFIKKSRILKPGNASRTL